MPDSFALWLYTSHRTEYCDSTIEHAQRPFNLNSEIDMTWSINDVDFVIIIIGFPECCRCCRCDSYATLLLLCHPVHCGSAFVDFAKLVVDTGIIQNALSSRSLTCVYVSHYADVSSIYKRSVHFVRSVKLKFEVRERLVSLCHSVGIFFLLESRTFAVVSSENFSRKFVGH